MSRVVTLIVALLVVLALCAAPAWAVDDQVLAGADALYRGQVAQAEEAFRRAVERNPDDDFAVNQLGLALVRQERFEEAGVLFAQVASRSAQNVFCRLWLGIIALADNDPGGGRGWFEDVLQRAPEHPGALYLMGVEAASRRDLKAAVDFFSRAGRADPRDADLQYRLAEAYRGLDMRANARLSYLRAIEVDPRHAPALVGLGWLAYDEGDRNQALRAWNRALTVAPGYGEARAGLAAVLVREGLSLAHAGRGEDARKYFAQALKVDPGNKAALYYLR